MGRSNLVPAVLTGAFRSVSALAVDAARSMVSTVAGLFGAIFACAVPGGGRG